MNRYFHALIFCSLVFLSIGRAQEAGEEARSVIKITPQTAKPSVMAMVPFDETNAFFLNKRGQVGVAKFSPGLSLIGWEYYSELKWNAHPSLAVGPNYSVIMASTNEVTQAFDTDADVELDFFQALIKDWPGRDRGSIITAGPVADSHGRLLFAISAPSAIPAGEGEEAPVEKSHIVAWHPEADKLVTITESQLPIGAFAVDRSGVLAARLVMPEYKGGFFISLTELPPFDSDAPSAVPTSLPFTLPSLVIPAELTKNQEPTELAFFREHGRDKLALVCPGSRQLIEVVHSKIADVWQGSILLRQILDQSIESVVEMGPGLLLGGGEDGFIPLNGESSKFRITNIELADDGIVLDFSDEVDRYEASRADNFLVQSVSLKGGESNLNVVPMIESDGRTIVLKTGTLSEGTVIRIQCQRLPSESGATLLSNAAFYTIHRKPSPEEGKEKADPR
ncbi:MAG: hypothetical protein P1U68_04555 [Verrucomicrobiales bacterium]|nr:hypothetical protein [Verrucomicrobiales bacterium]